MKIPSREHVTLSEGLIGLTAAAKNRIGRAFFVNLITKIVNLYRSALADRLAGQPILGVSTSLNRCAQSGLYCLRPDFLSTPYQLKLLIGQVATIFQSR